MLIEMYGYLHCPKCNRELSVDNFYVKRSRQVGKRDTWQTYCKDCWKGINHANKIRRKIEAYHFRP